MRVRVRGCGVGCKTMGSISDFAFPLSSNIQTGDTSGQTEGLGEKPSVWVESRVGGGFVGNGRRGKARIGLLKGGGGVSFFIVGYKSFPLWDGWASCERT